MRSACAVRVRGGMHSRLPASQKEHVPCHAMAWPGPRARMRVRTTAAPERTASNNQSERG
eukprot:scaffold6063_cov202-Prasinococcus_capsulatus_cf.AAC.1